MNNVQHKGPGNCRRHTLVEALLGLLPGRPQPGGGGDCNVGGASGGADASGGGFVSERLGRMVDEALQHEWVDGDNDDDGDVKRSAR